MGVAVGDAVPALHKRTGALDHLATKCCHTLRARNMRGRCEGVQGGVVKGTRGWCEVVEWDGVEVNLQYS